jgi:hypothetical protein
MLGELMMRRLEYLCIKNVLLPLVFLCFNSTASASALPFTLPEELSTKYGPIAPSCFMQLVGEKDNIKPINLRKSTCLSFKKSYNPYSLKRGFVGYEIKSYESSMRPVSIYYRYIGRALDKKNHYIFLVNWSGGGSGFFSELMELALNNDTLSLVSVLDGGDRCLGGIDDAKLKDGIIHYQKKMTPQMLLDANKKNNKSRAYVETGLQDCAVCCIGTLNMANDKVKGFSFNGYIPSTEKQESKQACFNSVIKSFGAQKKATIDTKAITRLQRRLKNRCNL